MGSNEWIFATAQQLQARLSFARAFGHRLPIAQLLCLFQPARRLMYLAAAHWSCWLPTRSTLALVAIGPLSTVHPSPLSAAGHTQTTTHGSSRMALYFSRGRVQSIPSYPPSPRLASIIARFWVMSLCKLPCAPPPPFLLGPPLHASNLVPFIIPLEFLNAGLPCVRWGVVVAGQPGAIPDHQKTGARPIVRPSAPQPAQAFRAAMTLCHCPILRHALVDEGCLCRHHAVCLPRSLFGPPPRPVAPFASHHGCLSHRNLLRGLR